jgi:hypothetical protein
MRLVPSVLRALASPTYGLDLRYRYRQDHELDGESPVDQSGDDYRAWLSEWATILAEISHQQAVDHERRYDRNAQTRRPSS